jgi:hypothetical protein
MYSASKALDNLPEQSRALLYLLALAPSGISRTLLLVQCNALKLGKRLDKIGLEQQLSSLHELGLLNQAESGRPLSVPATHHTLLLQHLSESRLLPPLSLALQAIAPPLSPWQVLPLVHHQQAFWLAVLNGSAEKLAELAVAPEPAVPPGTAHIEHPMTILLRDDGGRQLLQSRPAAIRSLLLQDYLICCDQMPLPNAQAYALVLHEYRSGDASLAMELLLQAVWHGDLATVASIGEHEEYRLIASALVQLLAGNAVLADQHYEEWLKQLRQRTGKRKLELPSVFVLLQCLMLLGSNDPARLPALKQALNTRSRKLFTHRSPFLLLQRLLTQLQGAATAADGPLPWPLPTELIGFDDLLLAVAAHWLDLPETRHQTWRTTLEAACAKAHDCGRHWLASEYDALLNAQFGRPRQLPHAVGTQPLVALYQRKEAWQHALQALAQLKSKPAAATVGKSSRMAWLLRHDRYGTELEPREQKLGAKGQWSKGRPVALQRLHEDRERMDFLNEQDRRVAASIRHSAGYYGNPSHEIQIEQALPHLVGHPALFWHDAPDVRIDLQPGEASLRLQVRDGQIQLQLQPQGISADHALLLEKETPTQLRLYVIGAELRQIAGIVGSGLSVPAAAKAQLVEAIGAIAPLLPIHSDVPGLGSHLEVIAADSTLYAHLLPLREGLRLQVLVRPLADGGWFRPGVGPERLLGERDGTPVQAQRELAREQQSLEWLLQQCPTLAMAERDGHEWQLEQPQEALQVLGELQALDASRLQCVWPEGERMRVRGRRELGQLRLSLRQQGDWFALQGELELDDGRVLQLRQLLELLRASPGRFIRLDERDWLALGDGLRRRLGELAHLAERIDDKGARLNLLAAPLLDTLAEEVDSFQADAQWQAHRQRLQSLGDYRPALPAGLHAELREYQHEGFLWLARLAQWGVGACLADDMGLGKTVQLLALLLHRAAQGAQLVVAPTSVVPNWQAEAQRFAPSLVLHDYQRERVLDGLGAGDVVLVSYTLLQQEQHAFAEQAWASVVLDEAQAIKNAHSQRSQAAMRLQAGFRVAATGTPVENHLGELWNLSRFLNPGLLGSQEQFSTRFAEPIERGDAAARRALKALLQPFLLRRLKRQVLDELPSRTDIVHKVALSEQERHQYEALRQQAVEQLDALDTVDGRKQIQVLAEITRLRRFCCHPSLVLPGSALEGSKLQALAEIVEELRAGGHKALIFSQFVDHLAIVRGWLDQQAIHYQYLDGATPARQRKERVDAFQAGAGELFLISLKAGGSGLNLTAADYVIHLDPWWNPAVEDQASDRAHRMGQQRPVTVYRLVAEHTIEEQIVALHERKRELAEGLLEGGEGSARLDAEALLQLLRAAA